MQCTPDIGLMYAEVYVIKTVKARMEWNGRQILHNEPQITEVKQLHVKMLGQEIIILL